MSRVMAMPNWKDDIKGRLLVVSTWTRDLYEYHRMHKHLSQFVHKSPHKHICGFCCVIWALIAYPARGSTCQPMYQVAHDHQHIALGGLSA